MKASHASLLLGLLLPLGGTAQAATPTDDFDLQIAFEQALEARDSGDIEAAIGAFHRLLAEHPDLHRVRLELAVAYARALRFDAARSQAQMVLDRPDLPDSVRPQVERFLERLAEVSKPHRWSASVAGGILSDSNVNAGPDAANAALPAFQERDDVGLVVNAGVTHGYLASGTVDVAGRERKLLWGSRAGVYSVSYQDEDDYDLDILSLSTGPALIAADGDRAQVRLQFDKLWLGGEDYADYVSLVPSLNLTEAGTGRVWTVELDAQSREFQRAVDTGREGTVLGMGAGVSAPFLDQRLTLAATVRWFEEDADDDQFSRGGIGIRLRATYDLTANDQIALRMRREWAEHDGVEPVSGLKRDETEARYALSASHRFDDAWSAEASYIYTDNESNVQAYDYDRSQMMATVKRDF